MTRVRIARPGAIETLGQEDYLLRLGMKFYARPASGLLL